MHKINILEFFIFVKYLISIFPHAWKIKIKKHIDYLYGTCYFFPTFFYLFDHRVNHFL